MLIFWIMRKICFQDWMNQLLLEDKLRYYFDRKKLITNKMICHRCKNIVPKNAFGFCKECINFD